MSTNESSDTTKTNSGNVIPSPQNGKLIDRTPKIIEENWSIGQTIIKDYIIENVLGVGGSGIVYLVRRGTTDENLALKAVPKKRLESNQEYGLFFNELRTWIELPHHRNIVECRFYRTIEEYICIFSEFVDCGSLSDWIKECKLLNVKDILSVAIGTVQGLKIAHGSGVVHQDIKPTNILMTHAGIPKLTDFGSASFLWKLKEEMSGTETSPGTRSMTVAYCSPEQAEGLNLGFASDVWSLALTILEMFSGKMTSKFGFLGRETLHSYLVAGRVEPYPEMPEAMFELLDKCLDSEIENRCTLTDLETGLHQIFRDATGHEWKDDSLEIPVVVSETSQIHDRSTLSGIFWDDPWVWADRLGKNFPENFSEIKKISRTNIGSRRSQALRDLEIFEICLRKTGDLISEGKIEFRIDEVDLMQNIALIQEYTEDLNGALNTYTNAESVIRNHLMAQDRDKAEHLIGTIILNHAMVLEQTGGPESALEQLNLVQKIRENQVYGRGKSEYFLDLIKVYLNLAMVMTRNGKPEPALNFSERALKILESTDLPSDTDEYKKVIAIGYLNHAAILRETGNLKDSQTYSRRAIKVFNENSLAELHSANAHFLASCFTNLAITASEQKQFSDALDLYTRAVLILEYLYSRLSKYEIRGEMASVYLNIALTLRYTGQLTEARTYLDNAIDIYRRMVITEANEAYAEKLFICYVTRGSILHDLTVHNDALQDFNRASRVINQLVDRDNRQRFSEHAVRVFVYLGNLYRDMKDFHSALTVYDQAIERMDHLVNFHGKTHLRGEIARCMARKAEALLKTGDVKSARISAKEADQMLRHEITNSGRADLRFVQNWLRSEHNELLR